MANTVCTQRGMTTNHAAGIIERSNVTASRMTPLFRSATLRIRRANSALGPHDTRLSSSLCSAQRNGHLKPIKHEPILSTILFRLLFLLSLFPLLFSFFLNSFFGRGDYAMTITRKRRTHFAHSQNVVDKRGCTRAITTQ